MNRDNLQNKYNELSPLYKRAANNTAQALEQFLQTSGIPFLTIDSRVKKFDSFYEKVSRKNYSSPFTENEDFCGVRIILYYVSDIEKVQRLVENNYNIHTTENKSTALKPNEFGYRSFHLILKIKESWCVTPNYKNLEGIKIELQIRTVLMHAWAEIEHKLGYKSKEQIPKDLQRKLYLLSAKLEDADTQFQEVTNTATKIKESTLENSKQAGAFISQELNLDSLIALETFYFPDYAQSARETPLLLDEIISNNLTIKDVSTAAEKIKPFSKLINDEIKGNESNTKTSRPNLLSYGLEVFSQNYYAGKITDGRRKIIAKVKHAAQITD